MATAHFAIEEIHPELFAAFRPVGEDLGRAEKPVITANLDRNAKVALPVTHGLKHPMFARFGDDKPVHLMAGGGARHLA